MGSFVLQILMRKYKLVYQRILLFFKMVFVGRDNDLAEAKALHTLYLLLETLRDGFHGKQVTVDYES
jgi:hypothetical protein